MAISAESLAGGNLTENFELGVHGKPGSTADTAQAADASVSPATKDVNEDGARDIPALDQIQEPVRRRNGWGKKLFAFFVLTALAAPVVASALVARSPRLGGEAEKPKIEYPTSTNDKSLKKTLQQVEKSAKELLNKWNSSSEQVREAFMKFYTPMLLVETFTEEKNIFWCKKYSDASKTQPLPEKTASKEEREDFAVRNMLLVTVFEAAETRLEFLNRIEELSKKHQIESVFSLEVERPLPQPTVEDGRDAFSFESFTRRLEKLGVQGVAQEGDSQGTVPWLVAQDLSNAVAIKAHYDASNMAVVDLYEDFLTFIEQTKVGKTEAERKRIENVILPESDVSVPLSVLADVVRSVKTTYEMEHFPAPQILSWRDQWNVPKLSSLTNDIRLSQKTMFDVALDSKHSALENWGYLEDIDSLATNILPSAVFLL